MNEWKRDILPYLTEEIGARVLQLPGDIREIRIRAGKPVMVGNGRGFSSEGIFPEVADVERMALAMLEGAPSSRSEEIRNGFVTLPGGHRAGFSGRAVMEEGQLLGVYRTTCIALRIARQVPGAAKPLEHYLFQRGKPQSLLLLSGPGGGKTTMLRDAARILSQKGAAVCVVDERSELAACREGVPSLDVGENTDVLDGCAKSQGMMLMLRAMSPQAIITDELGGTEDADAVEEMLRCGVAVIASAHASCLEEARERKGVGRLLKSGAFRYTALIPGVGEKPEIYDREGKKLA